jgi:2-oxoglutarate dehydrogenase complex dehydrogenase (E1) component-like enzyme
VHDVKEYMDRMYCGNTAVEFEHIANEDERLWLYENYE